jgi:magnesium chelatase family protein
MRIRKTDLASVPKATAEASADVRQRVTAARKTQAARNPRAQLNSRLRSKEIVDVSACDGKAKVLLSQAEALHDLSSRAYFKALKLARTIADLGGEPGVTESHMAEALQYMFPG